MFLQPAPPRVTKRSRLETCFPACCAVSLFASLRSGSLAHFSHAFSRQPDGQGGTKIILLVDTSARHAPRGAVAGRAAKAGELLAKASPGDQVAVFAFDTQTHPS